MRELSKEERIFLKRILEHKPQNNNGYAVFCHKKKKYKRSRVKIQLHINKKLEIWEVVHHVDGDRMNDSLENLEIIDTKNFDHHISRHRAGKRKS